MKSLIADTVFRDAKHHLMQISRWSVDHGFNTIFVAESIFDRLFAYLSSLDRVDESKYEIWPVPNEILYAGVHIIRDFHDNRDYVRVKLSEKFD